MKFLPTQYVLPKDGAPLREWLRPISAKLVSRRTSYFAFDPNPYQHHVPGGPTATKRHAPIDGPRARRMSAMGHSVDSIADILRATPTAVRRVINIKPMYGGDE